MTSRIALAVALLSILPACARQEAPEITDMIAVRGNFAVDAMTKEGKDVMVMLPDGMILMTNAKKGFEHVKRAEETTAMPKLQARRDGTQRTATVAATDLGLPELQQEDIGH